MIHIIKQRADEQVEAWGARCEEYMDDIGALDAGLIASLSLAETNGIMVGVVSISHIDVVDRMRNSAGPVPCPRAKVMRLLDAQAAARKRAGHILEG